MSKRIDYGQIAAKLDYPTLDKKLEQLAQREPPKNRKTAVDLLEPLRERIIALHRKGWSSQQLAEELKAAGVPVNPARLRECFNRWTTGGKGAAKNVGLNATNPSPRPPNRQRRQIKVDGARTQPVTASRNSACRKTDAELNAVAS